MCIVWIERRRERRGKEASADKRQIVQVPADGFRDGGVGDDELAHSAEEGVSVDVLSCGLSLL